MHIYIYIYIYIYTYISISISISISIYLYLYLADGRQATGKNLPEVVHQIVLAKQLENKATIA